MIDAADGEVDDSVVVQNDPTGAATELSIEAGGAVARQLEARGSSVVSLDGGTVRGDASSTEVSTLRIASGEVRATCSAGDRLCRARGRAAVRRSRRAGLGAGARDRRQHRGGVRASGSSLVEIDGGAIVQDVEARDSAFVGISGGTFLDTLIAWDVAVIEIRGIAFDVPFGPLAQTTGILTGTLLDGSAFHVGFFRTPGARIARARAWRARDGRGAARPRSLHPNQSFTGTSGALCSIHWRMMS